LAEVSSIVGFSFGGGCFVGFVEDESGVMGVDEGFKFGLVVSGLAVGFSGLDVGVEVGELFGEAVGLGVGCINGEGDVDGEGSVDDEGVGSGVAVGVGCGEGAGVGAGAVGVSGSGASRIGK
jgi:hypothetical protein